MTYTTNTTTTNTMTINNIQNTYNTAINNMQKFYTTDTLNSNQIAYYNLGDNKQLFLYPTDIAFYSGMKNSNCCHRIQIAPSYYINCPEIKKIEILKPNKVIKFTFSDDTIIKTICSENDVFEFDYSCYLAYSKYIFKKFLTIEGIERKAKELSENKELKKLVDKAIKQYFKEQKEEQKKKQKELEEKELKQKHAMKRAAKKAKAKEARINEIAAAIKKAKSDEIKDLIY